MNMSLKALTGFIKDYKSLCGFHGTDFQADVRKIYGSVHRSMVCWFSSEFGLEKVAEPPLV